MEKGLIIASFGTTVRDIRVKNIGNLEQKINAAIPEAYTLRAFTSRMVMRRLKERDNLYVFNEIEAYDQLLDRGICEEDIYIQPLHILPGVEYEKLVKLDRGTLGHPLFASREDLETFVDTMNFDVDEDEDEDEDEVLVLFGHGTYHASDIIYDQLQEVLEEKGHKNIFVVTVEGDTTIEDVLEDIEKTGAKKVILQPLMIVAGVHVIEDMDSRDEGSLRQILESKGFEVESKYVGLGELEAVEAMFIQKAKDLMNGDLGEIEPRYCGR